MGGKSEGQIDADWRKGPFFIPDDYEPEDYRSWKSWDDVPENYKACEIDALVKQGQECTGLACRVRGRRPGQERFQLLMAKVYELAAERLAK